MPVLDASAVVVLLVGDPHRPTLTGPSGNARGLRCAVEVLPPG